MKIVLWLTREHPPTALSRSAAEWIGIILADLFFTRTVPSHDQQSCTSLSLFMFLARKSRLDLNLVKSSFIKTLSSLD